MDLILAPLVTIATHSTAGKMFGHATLSYSLSKMIEQKAGCIYENIVPTHPHVIAYRNCAAFSIESGHGATIMSREQGATNI